MKIAVKGLQDEVEVPVHGLTRGCTVWQPHEGEQGVCSEARESSITLPAAQLRVQALPVPPQEGQENDE